MVACIGDFDSMVGFFLGMVGTVRLSSSFSSSSSSISSLVVALVLIMALWCLITIAGGVFNFSTMVTCSISFAPFFLVG